MDMMLTQWVISGIRLSVFVFILSGCGMWASHQTEVQDLPDDVKGKVSVGDTREKVRSTLGAPLIDARDLGLEVYRKSGRDFVLGWIVAPWVPIPLIGEKVIVVVLVIYDKHGLVKDISTGMVEHPYYATFWLEASDFVFANTASMLPPDMLLGPAVTWEDVQVQPTLDGRCDLVLVMRHYCPMEKVSLDNEVIANLSPGAVYCGFSKEDKGTSFAAIIRKDIPSGLHQLGIHQTTWTGDFNTSFECESGETVYAEFQAYLVLDWWSQHFEGAISISKNAPSSAVEKGELRQILWYGGMWYGPTTSSIPVSQ